MSKAQTTLISGSHKSQSGARREKPVGFCLLIMGRNVFATHDLPEIGSVIIGRDDSAAIPLSDPLASRRHAKVSIKKGPEGRATFSVEDLGSANGTFVRDERLPPHFQTPIEAGEAIGVGDLILMIQPPHAPLRPRRIWPHGHFEAHLALACERPQSVLRGIGVMRIGFAESVDPELVAAHLAEYLDTDDLLAQHCEGEFEALIAGVTSEGLDELAKRIVDSLAKAGAPIRVGAAHLPRDSRHADALMARADERMRGESAPAEMGDDAPRSPAMTAALKMAERAARRQLNAIVLGETGVGKEVMSRFMHRHSARASGPFVAINCGAFAENMLEAELFGHEKGAFTGAQGARAGLVEAADGGTLFLDEVAEMPPSMQVKFLRVVSEGEVLRIGANKPRKVTVWFVAATNRDLTEEVRRKRFREDLFFRLNGLTILVPPLRDRLQELLPLARRFVADACARNRLPAKVLSPAAEQLLTAYPWPGNIRELKLAMERAAALCDDDVIGPAELPVEKMTFAAPLRAADSETDSGAAPAAAAPSSEKDAQEKQLLLDALTKTGYNQGRAAALLGVARGTVIARMVKYGIPRPQKTTRGA